MENHSVIRIFCSKENPSFLPYHVSDKLFITEVARKYNVFPYRGGKLFIIYSSAMEDWRAHVQKSK
jgi:hypothetical protein